MTALSIKGIKRHIQFDGEQVKICKDPARPSNNDVTIPLQDISEIEFKKPTLLMSGHIRVMTPGRVFDSAYADPATVTFAGKKSTTEFESALIVLQSAVKARGPLRPERIADLEAEAAQHQDAAINDATRKLQFIQYNGHMVNIDQYQYGIMSIKRPIAGATAEFEHGSDRKRPTLTRIGAGALLAGPVGAIAGGMFKKDKTKNYITVVFSDGATVIIDGPAKDEKKMREWVAAFNRFSELETRRTERAAA